jgi:hypothetical protein
MDARLADSGGHGYALVQCRTVPMCAGAVQDGANVPVPGGHLNHGD